MMRLLKAAAIATGAVQAKEFHIGKPNEGIDECSNSVGICQQAFVTENGQSFQPSVDPQFSITYTSSIGTINRDELERLRDHFDTCFSLAELAFIEERISNRTNNNTTKDPVNFETYIMTLHSE